MISRDLPNQNADIYGNELPFGNPLHGLLENPSFSFMNFPPICEPPFISWIFHYHVVHV